MTRTAGIFRGAELSRLVVLAVIMIAGWLYVWSYLQARTEPVDPPPAASRPPAPIVADPSPEFAGLRDKTPLSFRDTAAYATLLGRARGIGAEALAAQARRDLLFTHLWERPERYRGVPVHLLGTARRVLSYESKLSRTGRLHEAWIFTPESQNHPYVCVFEDVPEGFPAGGDVSERVVFNGYFLKLMSYQAGDVPRAAPLLVGRLGWSPSAPTLGGFRPRAILLDGPRPGPDVPRLVLALALADAPLALPPAATDALRRQARRRDRPRSPLRLAQFGLRGGKGPPPVRPAISGPNAVGNEEPFTGWDSRDQATLISDEMAAKRGNLLAVVVGLGARCQVVQHVAALQTARPDHGQYPFHESAPAPHVGTPADPTPDHGETYRPLRRVIRRLDPRAPARRSTAPLPP